MLAERDRTFDEKEQAIGAAEVTLAEVRQSKREVEEQLRSMQRVNDHLEADKVKLLAEQAESNNARWELVTLRADHSSLKRELEAGNAQKATLNSQLDDADEQLRQLRQSYRAARDELSELRAPSAASAAAAVEWSVVESELRAVLATAQHDAQRAAADAAAAELARVTAEGQLADAKAELEASSRSLGAVKQAAAQQADRAEEAECESRELRSHLAVAREAANRAQRDTKLSPPKSPVSPADASERSELRRRVVELEAALADQKQMHAALEAQAEKRIAAVTKREGDEVFGAPSVSPADSVITAATSMLAATAGASAPMAADGSRRSSSSSNRRELGGGSTNVGPDGTIGAARMSPPSPARSNGSSASALSAADAKAMAEATAAEEAAAKATQAKAAEEAAAKVKAAGEARAEAEAARQREEAARAAEARAKEREEKRKAAEEARAVGEAKAAEEAAEVAKANMAAEAKAKAEEKAKAEAKAAAEAKKAEAKKAEEEAKRAEEARRAREKAEAARAAEMARIEAEEARIAEEEEARAEEDEKWRVIEEAREASAAAARMAAETEAEARKAEESKAAQTNGNGRGGVAADLAPGIFAGPCEEFGMGSAEGLVHCAFATLTHVGGSGDNPAKRQQDAYFMAVLGAEARVWGILDGHGPDNGTLAAETAAKAFTTWFEGHAAELTESPQKAMATAFEDAHNAIRTAIVRKYKDKGMPLRETQEGFLVEADGQPVDGGTTATVVALLQGHLLVVANVGDSDCLLGGYLPDGSIGFEQLCADHTPINANEYIRIAQMADHKPDDWEPAYFVYDGPDDSEDLLEIFTVSDSGQVEVDKEIADNLDELGVGYKTARFDRPCSLLVESDKYGQQKLGMTRTLGDFYMQYYGATWEPDVSCIDLFDIVAQLSQVGAPLGAPQPRLPCVTLPRPQASPAARADASPHTPARNFALG